MKEELSEPPHPAADHTKTDSLGKRYSYKLMTNLLFMPIGLLMQAMVPRALGPVSYGDYTFLTRFFQDFIGFVDSASSSAYYQKICRRPHETDLINFYWLVIAAVVLVFGSLLQCAFLGDLAPVLWPGQAPRYILLAAVFALCGWIVGIAQQTVDAFGATVDGEVTRLIQRVVALVVIAVLFFENLLTLSSYWLAQIGLMLLLFGLLQRTLRRHQRSFLPHALLGRGSLLSYIKEFWAYSHPLMVYALFGMLSGVVDRWLLQHYEGSVNQGYYGLGSQIGSVCFVFTSAMTPLLQREFSMAAHVDDRPKMARDFSLLLPRFFFLAAFLGVFVAVQADQVVAIFGGSAFQGAVWTVALMVLAPIHQTYGQLSGSLFFATSRTDTYRNIGIFHIVLGFAVTWWLLAPVDQGGWHLGAIGLALKTVGIQFIAVNVQLWFNTRYLMLPFMPVFLRQIMVLLVLFGLAISTRGLMPVWSSHTLMAFMAAGMVYGAGTVAIVWLFPALAGMDRAQLRFWWSKFTHLVGV